MKLLRTGAILILILLPYYPITENFFPPEAQVNQETFAAYIAICTGIFIAGFLLLRFCKPGSHSAGWLLFAMGLTTLVPLHLGPPREDAGLLTAAGIEQFRYGALMVAVLLLLRAGLKVISPPDTTLSKIILGMLCLMALLNLWDNYSSFRFSSGLKDWVAAGKNAEDFFPQFDFHMPWRTLARASLYVAAIALSFALFRQSAIRKWQFAVISIFSLTGIVFCVLCLLSAFEEYYFPFMVPAIALAPAYWLGIALLTNKQKIQGSV